MRTPRWLQALAFFLTTTALLWATASYAQDKSAAVLQRLDKNGDGKVSLEEWPNPPKLFNMIDTDGNGLLTLEELKVRFANSGEATGSGSIPPVAPTNSSTLYFVDAHSQMDGETDEEKILALMAKGGVHRTILSAQKGRTWQSVADFAQRNPEHITAAAVIKGGGYHSGGEPRSEYFERLKAQAQHPGIQAMAEVLVRHDGMGRWYEIQVDLTDELVQAALNVAKQKGWPFMVHIEFAALSDRKRASYMEQLATLLQANPQHPFVMMHMGELEEPDVRKLLAQHPNLYFLLSATTNVFQVDRSSKGGVENKPFTLIFDGNVFKPQWRQIFLDYPNQFVFALDNANSALTSEKPYMNQMRQWWAAMKGLPTPVAAKIAHENAERLWKLSPRKEGGMLPPDGGPKRNGPEASPDANKPG